jgi:uncharacterized protein (DUF488 family)
VEEMKYIVDKIELFDCELYDINETIYKIKNELKNYLNDIKVKMINIADMFEYNNIVFADYKKLCEDNDKLLKDNKTLIDKLQKLHNINNVIINKINK